MRKQSLLTLDEAADYLTVSPRFMRRLVFERRIAFVKVGKFVRFDPRDIDEWLSDHRVEAVG